MGRCPCESEGIFSWVRSRVRRGDSSRSGSNGIGGSINTERGGRRAIPTGHRRKPVKPKASYPIRPANRAINNPVTRSVVLPGRSLSARMLDRRKHRVAYTAPAEVCGACALKSRCAPRLHNASCTFTCTKLLSCVCTNEPQPPRCNCDAPHRGASLRHPEIPSLRISTVPSTRSCRSADRNQSGDLGLQHQTHDQRPRRPQTGLALST